MNDRKKAHENQAEHLKQIFDELQQNAKKSGEPSNEKGADDHSIPKIDVLNLPPRKEVHGDNNARTRLSISGPFLRFLSVIFLILIVIFGTYFLWGEELVLIIKSML